MRIGTTHGRVSRPLPTALAAPDNDEVLTEVHVLEAQAGACQQAQAAAVEPPRHEGVPARHGGAQPLDLRLCEHGGQPWVACASDRGDRGRKERVQDIPGEKNQGVQGLLLGGGRHLARGGTVGEQARHLHGPEPVRRGLAAAAMEIATYPVAISLRGAVGVVRRAAHLRTWARSVRPGFGRNVAVFFF